MTNNPEKCDFYRNESENVKSRWYCSVPATYAGQIPNNKNDCEKPNINGVWTESKALKNIIPPDCIETQFTRDNHLVIYLRVIYKTSKG